jgi:hypothetical protein
LVAGIIGRFGDRDGGGGDGGDGAGGSGDATNSGSATIFAAAGSRLGGFP